VEYAIISGLAILWGEFSGEKRWKDLIDSELSKFVNKDENQRTVLTQIIEMLSYRRDHMIGIGDRDLIQTNWELRIANSIRNKGLCQYEYKDFGIPVLKTESRLLRAFCGNSFDDIGFMHETESVYLILCLNQYVPHDKQYESKFKWEEDLNEADA